MTGFQLILWAGHCFDLAVKQILMARQAGVFHNLSTYILYCNLIQNWTLSQTKASLFNWGHASVRLPGVQQTNVGHSKFGYRKF